MGRAPPRQDEQDPYKSIDWIRYDTAADARFRESVDVIATPPAYINGFRARNFVKRFAKDLLAIGSSSQN